MRFKSFLFAVAVYFFSFAGPNSVSRAALITINFDDQSRGAIVANQYVSKGVTISADNFTPGHPDKAIIFDSNNHTTKTDTDLQYNWKGGNLYNKNSVRKILIIAENITDANNDGKVDDPNDEGGQPAGFLKFKFNLAHAKLGFDLIDCDGPSEFKADRGYVMFRLGGVEVGRVGWGAFIDSTSAFYDPTIKWGDRYANRIQPFDVSKLRIPAYDELWFNIGFSSAIDAVVFDDGFSVVSPEPASLAMLLVPMLLMRRTARRR